MDIFGTLVGGHFFGANILDIFSGHFDTLDIPVVVLVEVLSFSSLLCLQSRTVMGMIRSEDDFPLSIPRG